MSNATTEKGDEMAPYKTPALTENRGEIHLEVLLSIDRGFRDSRRVRFAILKDGANTDVPPNTAAILQQLFGADLTVGQTVIEVYDHRFPAGAASQPGLPMDSKISPAEADLAREEWERSVSELHGAAVTFDDPVLGPIHAEPAMFEGDDQEPITPPRPISAKPRPSTRPRATALTANEAAGLLEAVPRAKPRLAGRRAVDLVADTVPQRLHGANGVAVALLGLGTVWALWGVFGALS